jgi:hypothetical protein
MFEYHFHGHGGHRICGPRLAGGGQVLRDRRKMLENGFVCDSWHNVILFILLFCLTLRLCAALILIADAMPSASNAICPMNSQNALAKPCAIFAQLAPGFAQFAQFLRSLAYII